MSLSTIDFFSMQPNSPNGDGPVPSSCVFVERNDIKGCPTRSLSYLRYFASRAMVSVVLGSVIAVNTNAATNAAFDPMVVMVSFDQSI